MNSVSQLKAERERLRADKTEEDLLRFQEEFLAQQHNEQGSNSRLNVVTTSAGGPTVIRASGTEVRRVGQQTREERDEENKIRQRHNQGVISPQVIQVETDGRDPTLPFLKQQQQQLGGSGATQASDAPPQSYPYMGPPDLLGGIVERNVVERDVIAPPPLPQAQAFPAAVHRGKKPSRFARKRAEQQQQQQQQKQTQQESSPARDTDLGNPFSLTGTKDIKDMSEAEILQAQAEIKQTLSADSIAFLLKRGQDKGKGQGRGKGKGKSQDNVEGAEHMAGSSTMARGPRDVGNMPPVINDPNLPSIEDVPQLELEKMEWMTDVQPTTTTKPAASQHTLDKWRFDLNGSYIPPDATVEDQSLFHHGDDPDKGGYTLGEMKLLLQSKMSGQRVAVLRMLAGAVSRYRSDVLPFILDNKFIGPLRVALDDKNKTVLACAIHCIAVFIADQETERVMNLVGDNDISTRYLRLALAADRVAQAQADTAADSDLPQTDEQRCEEDLISGLLHMGIGVRLRYLLQTNRCSSYTQPLLRILIRLARHSLTSASELAAIPDLLTVVAQLIPTALCASPLAASESSASDEVRFQTSLYALRLATEIAAAGTGLCQRIVSEGLLAASERYITYSGPVQPPSTESDKIADTQGTALFVQTCRFWSVLLNYGVIQSMVVDYTPIVLEHVHRSCRSGGGALGITRGAAAMRLLTALAQSVRASHHQPAMPTVSPSAPTASSPTGGAAARPGSQDLGLAAHIVSLDADIISLVGQCAQGALDIPLPVLTAAIRHVVLYISYECALLPGSTLGPSPGATDPLTHTVLSPGEVSTRLDQLQRVYQSVLLPLARSDLTSAVFQALGQSGLLDLMMQHAGHCAHEFPPSLPSLYTPADGKLYNRAAYAAALAQGLHVALSHHKGLSLSRQDIPWLQHTLDIVAHPSYSALAPLTATVRLHASPLVAQCAAFTLRPFWLVAYHTVRLSAHMMSKTQEVRTIAVDNSKGEGSTTLPAVDDTKHQQDQRLARETRDTGDAGDDTLVAACSLVATASPGDEALVARLLDRILLHPSLLFQRGEEIFATPSDAGNVRSTLLPLYLNHIAYDKTLMQSERESAGIPVVRDSHLMSPRTSDLPLVPEWPYSIVKYNSDSKLPPLSDAVARAVTGFLNYLEVGKRGHHGKGYLQAHLSLEHRLFYLLNIYLVCEDAFLDPVVVSRIQRLVEMFEQEARCQTPIPVSPGTGRNPSPLTSSTTTTRTTSSNPSSSSSSGSSSIVIDISTMVTKFETFFQDLVTHFVNLSFGNHVYASLIALFLRRGYDRTLRSLVLSECAIHAPNSIIDARLLIDVSGYLVPCEDDPGQVASMAATLVAGHFSRTRGPQWYTVFLYHVAHFIYQGNDGSDHGSSSRRYRLWKACQGPQAEGLSTLTTTVDVPIHRVLTENPHLSVDLYNLAGMYVDTLSNAIPVGVGQDAVDMQLAATGLLWYDERRGGPQYHNIASLQSQWQEAQ